MWTVGGAAIVGLRVLELVAAGRQQGTSTTIRCPVSVASHTTWLSGSSTLHAPGDPARPMIPDDARAKQNRTRRVQPYHSITPNTARIAAARPGPRPELLEYDDLSGKSPTKSLPKTALGGLERYTDETPRWGMFQIDTDQHVSDEHRVPNY